jgi:hypothetical protein
MSAATYSLFTDLSHKDPTTKIVEDTADRRAFLVKELGMKVSK